MTWFGVEKECELPITRVIKKGNISEEMMIFREYLDDEQST